MLFLLLALGLGRGESQACVLSEPLGQEVCTRHLLGPLVGNVEASLVDEDLLLG